MKAKTILAAVFTAICWISLCLDWDILMYLTGFIALVLLGLDDLQVYFREIPSFFREVTKKIRHFSVKSSVTSTPPRKEVVKA